MRVYRKYGSMATPSVGINSVKILVALSSPSADPDYAESPHFNVVMDEFIANFRMEDTKRETTALAKRVLKNLSKGEEE